MNTNNWKEKKNPNVGKEKYFELTVGDPWQELGVEF